MITIRELTKASPKALEDINALVYQLSERLPKCSMELLTKIVADKNVELWVAQEDETIVGMATLAVVVIPEGERAQIEDVVVDGKYRGQGLGKQLSEKLIARARERKISSISLSSRADREAANKLYQKLGFEQWPTNVYRLKL